MKMNIKQRMFWYPAQWIAAWVDVLCGVCCIVTLTLYRPWWEMSIRAWISDRMMKLHAKK